MALTGIPPPVGEDVLDREYRVRSVRHMLDVELGLPQFTPSQPLLVTAFSRIADGYLDRTFEKCVHLPVLSFFLGYAF